MTTLPPGDLRGRVVLITGATSGIGRAAAAALAWRGATLIIAGRDPGRVEAARADLRAATGNDAIEAETADLERQADVRALAARVTARHDRLHVLINNAGAIYMKRRLTPDGIEATLAVNHLAPFLLTNLLLDRLRAAAPARVVTVTSEMHRLARLDLGDLQGARRWSGVAAYSLTKLMNLLFTFELGRRLAGSGVVAHAAHPGGVDTGIWRRIEGYRRAGVALLRPFLATPEKGAAGIVALAADPAYADDGGVYLDKGRRARPSAQALDPAAAAGLWSASAALAPLLDQGGAP